MQRLAGKVAIVTGASSGLGEATAGEGAKVVLAARRAGRLRRPRTLVLSAALETPWRSWSRKVLG